MRAGVAQLNGPCANGVGAAVFTPGFGGLEGDGVELQVDFSGGIGGGRNEPN